MKLIFQSFLLLLLSFHAMAQEVDIYFNPYSGWGGSSTYCFNDRFRPDNHQSFSLMGTAYYKQKNVKRIEILDPYDQVCWMTELDKQGKILKSGIRIYQYFATTQRMGNEGTDTTVISYFQDNQLIKLDTSIVYVFKYQRGDTIVSFNRTITKSYKRGSLINEQNEYYNEKYLGNPLYFKGLLLPVFVFDSKGKLASQKNGPRVYLSEKLKTNYDSLKLYLCQSRTSDSDLYATGDGGKTDLPQKQLQKHAFYKYCSQSDGVSYFADGEDFNEPSEYREAMFCGNALSNMQQYGAGVSYGYQQNENELHELFFSDYYPIDTTKVDAANPPAGQNAVLLYAQPYQRRMPTAERTVMYRFRYEYFEEEIDQP